MRRMLVVTQHLHGSTGLVGAAVVRGATDPAIGDEVDVAYLPAVEVGPAEVQAADAVVLVTTERFGSVAGLTKDFLERIWEPCLATTRGTPFALVVRAGNDGAGTVTAVERVVTGLAWRTVHPPLLVVGDAPTPAHLSAASELGATVAAGLATHLF